MQEKVIRKWALFFLFLPVGGAVVFGEHYKKFELLRFYILFLRHF